MKNIIFVIEVTFVFISVLIFAMDYMFNGLYIHSLWGLIVLIVNLDVMRRIEKDRL